MAKISKEGKFTIDLDSDHDIIKKLKAEEEARTKKEPVNKKEKVNIETIDTASSNIVTNNIENNNVESDNVESDNVESDNVESSNVDKIDIEKPKRKRERQAVTALREALIKRLGNKKEALIKLGEIAEDIGFDLSTLHYSKKELSDRGEFIFNRSFGPREKGLIVCFGNKENS